MSSPIIAAISGGSIGSRINSLANLGTVLSNGLHAISDIARLNISGNTLWTVGVTSLTLLSLPQFTQRIYNNANSERLIALGAIVGCIWIPGVPLFWNITFSGGFIGGVITATALSIFKTDQVARAPIRRVRTPDQRTHYLSVN